MEKQKKKILHDEWKDRHGEKLEKRVVKDTLVPVALASAVGAFTVAADMGISNAAATSSLAAAQGIPGYGFNESMVSAIYTGYEQAGTAVARKVGDFVSDI